MSFVFYDTPSTPDHPSYGATPKTTQAIHAKWYIFSFLLAP